MMKRRPTIFRWFVGGLVSIFLFSCSDNSSEDTPSESSDTSAIKSTVSEEKPSDSSFKLGVVYLNMNSDSQLGLSLSGIDAGSGIEITEAKLSVAAIRLKPNKEISAEEEKLNAEIKEQEKADVSAVEGATLEAFADPQTASLSNNGNGKDKPTKEDETVTVKFKKGFGKVKSAAKTLLAGKKDEFSKKEKNNIDALKKADASIKLGGPYIFDAVNGTISPSLDSFQMTDGSYRRVAFQLRRNWSVEKDNPLFGNVLYIKGNYNNGTKIIPFEVETHVAMNFIIRGDGAATVAADINNQMKIIFGVASWFEGVDLTNAVVDEDDQFIYINHKSNSEILKSIKTNIKTKTRFGKDANEDNELSDSEVAGEGEAETGDSLE